jgi:hypothetical protein
MSNFQNICDLLRVIKFIPLQKTYTQNNIFLVITSYSLITIECFVYIAKSKSMFIAWK